MKPVYIENSPIKKIMYRPLYMVDQISPPLKFFKDSSFKMMKKAVAAIRNPWPKSPNMTANKNGNVMIVNGPILFGV